MDLANVQGQQYMQVGKEPQDRDKRLKVTCQIILQCPIQRGMGTDPKASAEETLIWIAANGDRRKKKRMLGVEVILGNVFLFASVQIFM